jgi:hypothetical protein
MTPDTDTQTDGAILFADGGPTQPISVQIGGQDVPVRELSWAASMRLMPRLRGLLADLRALALAEGEIPDSAVDALLYDHPDAWIALVAASCGRPAEWVEALAGPDGDTLRSAAWAANAGFFSRQLVLSATIGRALRPAAPSPSPSCSPTSSAPDSDPTTTPSPVH